MCDETLGTQVSNLVFRDQFFEFEGVLETILLTCLYNLRMNYFIFPKQC